MTAPVTDQNYTQQINQAFDFLKNATPQQMQLVGQQVKNNPQSPEAMALAMAAQYQQQMRAAQQPPAPQGTVLQQKLGAFQQAAGPAQGGIPAIGANQMGMQQVAQANPMRNAGIAAAPENTAPPQQPQNQGLQGIATGGIAALAHGGTVRHFDEGGYTIPEDFGVTNPNEGWDGEYQIPKDFGMVNPAEGWDRTGIAALKMPLSYEQETPKVAIPAEGKDKVIHAPAETSSAKAIEESPSFRDKMLGYKNSFKELLGPEADISEELDMAKQASADARRDKILGTMAQGIGGMLSAQTPYIGQALGAGLMAGASGYSQGAANEQAVNKDLMALQMAHKKALVSGDRQAAELTLSTMMKEKDAAAAAAAERQKQIAHHKTEMEKTALGITGDVKKQNLKGEQEMSLEELKGRIGQNLEKYKLSLVNGDLPADKKATIFNALVGSQMTPEDIKAQWPAIMELIRGSSSQPMSSLGSMRPVGNLAGYGISTPQQAQ